MAGIADGFRSFWHAMTSYDRHANHDSPYRSLSNNTHHPLGVGRNPPLDSVTSPALESNPNLPYGEQDAATRSTTALAMNTNVYSPRSPTNGLTSPITPYSPGMRSASVSAASEPPVAGGGIALQDFADGMPPAPPVAHSWSKIETWAEENYYELWEQLCTPATVNDINELEYQLDCSLPTDVRESIQIHDGQERLGMPTGIIFGAMLMDCEEILDEWKNWRVVEKEFLATSIGLTPGPAAAQAGPSNGSASIPRNEIQARQDCQPEGAIQKVYTHPGWIPLVRDWGGNYIAVDLAPGPKGIWGQIILCGRDYDCKYTISKSWSHFLAMVADDMLSPHWYVDEESGELKLKDPRAPKSEPSYMEILRVRNERKYGRRRFRRPGSRPGSQPGSKPGSAPGSPHLSAMSPNGTTRGGLTRPPKEPSTLSDNHLKPPSKKSKQLRSVTEEPSVPDASSPKAENAPIKEAASSTILDESTSTDPVTSNIQALTDVSLDDDKEPPKLNRSSTDLISHPPMAAIKRSSTIEV